jgi:hypothetical protein
MANLVFTGKNGRGFKFFRLIDGVHLRAAIFGMILFGCTSLLSSSPTSYIKYNGVYFIPYAGGFSVIYLRFYENGNVINVNSRGNPNQIKSWFNYETENENISKGTYTIEGNKISFTIISETVSVEYRGIITESGLILDSYSSNGNESKNRIFVFFEW